MGDIIVTPTGRFIWGDIHTPNDKDGQGNPRIDAKTGKPRLQFDVSIAIVKAGPWWETPWGAAILAEAQTSMAKFIQYPTFAWKVKDGDALNLKGQPHFPGHWIINTVSGADYPPKVVDANAGVIDPNTFKIKRGDFVRLAFTAKGNDNAQKPGVYLNLQMLQFIAYGEALGGWDAGSVFGASPIGPLPAGASLTPMAAAMPSLPPAAPQGYPAPAAPQGYPAPAAPQGYPAPAAPQGYPPAAPGQGYPAPAAPQGYPPAAPGQGYPAPAAPQGYPAPAAPQGYPAPAAPQGYPAPAAPQGYPAPANPAGVTPHYGFLGPDGRPAV